MSQFFAQKIEFAELEPGISAMDRLTFYSKSADKLPGADPNEWVTSPMPYMALTEFGHWRRKLSNFWIAPFFWDEKRWNTVEHAFQAYKFKNLDPQFYDMMSLDSGSLLSKQDGLVARQQRKHLILTHSQLKDWSEISPGIMTQLLEAKFKQCEQCRQVLLLTGETELWHYAGRGLGYERWTNLEAIRTQLRAERAL